MLIYLQLPPVRVVFVHDSVKKYLVPLLNPVAVRLYSWGVTPNRATGLSILFKIISIGLIASNQFLLAVVSILLDYFFDVMDGTIARAFRLETTTGLYLDMSSDAVLRLLWYPALVWSNNLSIELAIVAGVLIIVLFLFSVYVHIRSIESSIPFFFLVQSLLIPGFILNEIVLFAWIVLVVHAYFVVHNLVVLALFQKNSTRISK